MHFVIMGCGRVGSTLAQSLARQGHDVAVIDRDTAAFRRLGPDFEGRRVTGVGFDRDTLVKAGIEQAYAFAAVSSGDNSNILSARVARETYGVENVVARIYDPGRAEVYQRLGIPTVGTVTWTADRILRRLVPYGAVPQYTDPTGHVVIAEIPAHPGWVGWRLREVERHTGARIAFSIRLGVAHLPDASSVHQEHDLLHVLCRSVDLQRVERLLLDPPAGHD